MNLVSKAYYSAGDYAEKAIERVKDYTIVDNIKDLANGVYSKTSTAVDAFREGETWSDSAS